MLTRNYSGFFEVIFKFLLLCAWYVCVCVWGGRHLPPYLGRSEGNVVAPVLPLNRFWGSNLGCLVCEAGSLPTEPSHPPSDLFSFLHFLGLSLRHCSWSCSWTLASCAFPPPDARLVGMGHHTLLCTGFITIFFLLSQFMTSATRYKEDLVRVVETLEHLRVIYPG